MALDGLRPQLVHDGIEELDQIPLGTSIDLFCPRCGFEFAVDPIEVALAARSVGLCSTKHDRATAEHLADVFDWELHTLDGSVFLTGHRGLSPGITPRPCPHCHRQVWIITSTGELQPARNATAVEGAVVPPNPERSDIDEAT